jgi:hypothetical protein
MFKSIFTALVVVMVSSLGASSVFATIGTATLTDDTWGEKNNTQLHGASTNLPLQNQGNVVAWNFAKFDLSAIGANQVIDSANLRLEYRADNSYLASLEVREMADGTWTEDDLNGTIAEPLIGNVLGTGTFTYINNAAWDVFNFDVTSYVQAGAGDFIVSFAVTAVDLDTSGSGTLRALGRSKEHSTESFRKAKLTVTHSLIPEPATLAFLGLGGLAMLRRRHVQSA